MFSRREFLKLLIAAPVAVSIPLPLALLAQTKDAGSTLGVVLYGKARTAGTLIYAVTTGAANEFLHLVAALAPHEIESVNTVFLNDIEVQAERFSGHVTIKSNLGSEPKSVSYLHATLKWNPAVFADGIPRITADISGRKVWDPRINPGDPSVRTFSNNAALCQLDYLSKILGYPTLSIDERSSWQRAADVSDAMPTCDGAFGSFGRPPIETIEDLLKINSGSIVYKEGKTYGYAGEDAVAAASEMESQAA